MHTRSRNAIVLVAVALAMAGGLAALSRGRRLPDLHASALDAVPAGAMLVAVVDLDALRASPAFAPVFRSSREIPGLGTVRDVCGFDPIDKLHEIAVSVPADGEAGEFGLVAAGPVDDEALVACASKVIERRGGRPVVTPIGTFRGVRDATMASTGGEIAVRKGGPVLLGAGTYLRSMIDAAEGRIGAVRGSPAHALLSREVGEGALRATVVLTAEQRETLAIELRGAGAAASPTASITSAGASLRLGPEVTVHAVVTCDAAAACADLARSLEAARQARAADPMLRLAGVGALLERLRLEPEGELLHGRVALPAEDAAALVDRLIAIRARSRALEAPGPSPAVSASAALPAEDAGAPDKPEKPARSRPRKPRKVRQ